MYSREIAYTSVVLAIKFTPLFTIAVGGKKQSSRHLLLTYIFTYIKELMPFAGTIARLRAAVCLFLQCIFAF